MIRILNSQRELPPNFVQHPINLCHDPLIPYPYDPKAGHLQLHIPCAVILLPVIVYIAVKFNDQLFFRAVEIHDELADRMLPVEFMTVQCAVTQISPQAFFGRRLRLSELLRPFGNILRRFRFHNFHYKPPLAFMGEGVWG